MQVVNQTKTQKKSFNIIFTYEDFQVILWAYFNNYIDGDAYRDIARIRDLIFMWDLILINKANWNKRCYKQHRPIKQVVTYLKLHWG